MLFRLLRLFPTIITITTFTPIVNIAHIIEIVDFIGSIGLTVLHTTDTTSIISTVYIITDSNSSCINEMLLLFLCLYSSYYCCHCYYGFAVVICHGYCFLLLSP